MIRSMQEIVTEAKRREECVMAVAVAHDDNILKAVADAVQLGIINPILVGDREKILAISEANQLGLLENQIVDEKDMGEACKIATKFVRDGTASLLMKGNVGTSLIMKAALNKDFGIIESDLLSHVLLLEVDGYDRLFYVTDSALNIAPTLQQKVVIIQNAVSVAHSLGNSLPKVAVLCAVEKVNPKMPCTVDAQELSELNAKQIIKNCYVQGPMALDNAVSEEASVHKGVVGVVAGRADILLVPNIEAGNMLNKSMEYFAHAKKAGVVVGAKSPIVLTSRATSPESKLYSIALGVLVASDNVKNCGEE